MRYILLIGLLLAAVPSFPQSRQIQTEWKLQMDRASALYEAGNLKDSIVAFQLAQDLVDRNAMPPEYLAKTLEGMAMACADDGQWNQAERQYQRALAIVDKLLGRDSFAYALLLGSLSTVRPGGTAPDGSVIRILRNALEKRGSEESLARVNIMRNCLARLLLDERQPKEAEFYLEAAYAGLREQGMAATMNGAIAAHALGSVEYELHKFADAVRLLEESLAIRQAIVGPNSASSILTLSNLANAYWHEKRVDDSCRTFEKVIAIVRANPGMQTNIVYGVVLQNYAAILRKTGRKEEARRAAASSREIISANQRRNGAATTVPVAALLTGH